MRNVSIPDALCAEVDELPDFALTSFSKTSEGYYYAVMRRPTDSWSLPDFSTCSKKKNEAVSLCAKKIRDDIRGIGRYTPHFSTYELTYILLPVWRLAAKCQSYQQRLGANGQPALEQGTSLELDECGVCGKSESEHGNQEAQEKPQSKLYLAARAVIDEWHRVLGPKPPYPSLLFRELVELEKELERNKP